MVIKVKILWINFIHNLSFYIFVEQEYFTKYILFYNSILDYFQNLEEFPIIKFVRGV